MKNFPQRFFIAGTDTNVGKTVVSAVLTHGLDSYYWKPIQSGQADPLSGDEYTDSEFLASTGIERSRILKEQYLLKRPLSPHLSASLENKRISMSDLNLPQIDESKKLIVEGAGGLLVPLNEKDLLIDLISKFAIPVLLVARSALGTINHSLLSLAALRMREIQILGIVMTGAINEENRKAIEHYGKIKVIAQVPILPDFKAETLQNCFKENFNGGENLHGEEKPKNLASVYANAHGGKRP
ncbi:MAG: dethiobiotin synthase [Candidatus Obscuribacterales bacterium]|nr:dethiobiotin synthase [Candidatus Obscuribacterales bacterium]